MHVSVWAWAALLVVAPVLLALDLFVLPRGRDAIPARAALVWTAVWTLVGLSFMGVVWAMAGEAYAVKYATSFVVERGLTVDQVLVYGLIIVAFGPPRPARQRTVFLALWVGLLLKLPLIALGTAIGRHGPGDLRWLLAVLFGLGGAIFVRNRTSPPDIVENRLVAFLGRHLPLVERWSGSRYVIDVGGRRVYTLAFVMLAVMLSADFYFAATVPLAFSTQKPGFLVLASSLFAIVGIRSLYWWAASVQVDRVQLRLALAVVLWLVGLELVIQPFAHDPSWVLPSLLIVTIAWPLVSARRSHGSTYLDAPVDDG
jgi:tellurite resistance protein TerC